MARKRLGDLLTESGLISQQQLEEALAYQTQHRVKLGDALTQLGIIQETNLIEVLEFQYGIPHVTLSRTKIDSSLLGLITEDMAKRHQAIPIRRDGNRLVVAMADPMDYYAIDDLRVTTNLEIQPVIAASGEIKQYIGRLYGLNESVSELLRSVQKELESPQSTNNIEVDAPIVRMVNQLISEGIARRVSDIHIEPFVNELVVRFRIDGLLRKEQILPKQMHAMLLARLKVMSNLNVSERRLPQDGRMQMEQQFGNVDVRVSIIPTIHGEKAVLRLLDKSKGLVTVSGLQFSAENETHVRRMLGTANGIVLITGPTGSGKTTTLYSAVAELCSDEKNIITVEDPVEYEIHGINQTQVNSSIGYTFAKGLRAILRQDPDIVMVGEIRDEETAEIAVRAALTGHLVFSTMHTNDAPSTAARLTDMGVEPYLVASAMTGIVAQRLVRKICPSCKQLMQPSDADLLFFLNQGIALGQLYCGRGCSLCLGTGYLGRIAIQEVLKMDDEFRALMLKGGTVAQYRAHMKEMGLASLVQDGLAKSLAGMTTVEEVMRATLRD